MIYPFDFHTHTNLCDGKDSIRDMIKSAKNKKMKARIPNQGGQANMMKRLQQMQDDMARVQKECEEAECGYILTGGGNFSGVCLGLDQAVSKA